MKTTRRFILGGLPALFLGAGIKPAGAASRRHWRASPQDVRNALERISFESNDIRLGGGGERRSALYAASGKIDTGDPA